jgi:hypothetical protein
MSEARGLREAVSAERIAESRFANVATWIYRRLLRLYPHDFRSMFGGEMQQVFTQILKDANRHGAWGVVGSVLKELRDLPVALFLQHLHERRKRTMQYLSFNTVQDVKWIRWVARLLSLVFAAMVITTIVFNILGLATMLPTVIVFAAATVFMLLAWHWEKMGGMLTLIASPFALASVVWVAVKPESFGLDLIAKPLVFSLIGLAFTFAILIVGWLFVSVSQHGAAGTQLEEKQSRAQMRWILIGVGIAIVVIVLLGLILLKPVFFDTGSMIRNVTPGVPLEVLGTRIPPAGP